MNTWQKGLLPLLFFLAVHNIHAFDMEITGKTIEGYSRKEYNRTSLYYGELSSIGAIALNDRYVFKSGISIGKTAVDTDIKLCNSARFDPFAGKPLQIAAAYLYTGLPEYRTHAHTILPVIAYNARWAGIGIGTGLRFTSFSGEPALFEAVLSFSGYVNFICKEALRIGIRCANFNDFSAGNMGSYALTLNSAVRLTKNWSIMNDLELMQSGSVALSAGFYGIAWRGGAQFTW